MSKFNSRLNKLIIKTHDYFSRSDFELIRDYWKAQMDENSATLEKYEKICARIDGLIRSSLVSGNKELGQEAEELYRSDKNIRLVVMYQLASKNAKNPQGVWIRKSYSNKVTKSLNNARKYFRDKRKV